MDLRAMFRRFTADRVFNIIDTIFVDESLSDARDEEARGKLKAKLNTAYDKIVREGSSNDADGAYASTTQPYGYLQPDEHGYPGLEPPMG